MLVFFCRGTAIQARFVDSSSSLSYSDVKSLKLVRRPVPTLLSAMPHEHAWSSIVSLTQYPQRGHPAAGVIWYPSPTMVWSVGYSMNEQGNTDGR